VPTARNGPCAISTVDRGGTSHVGRRASACMLRTLRSGGGRRLRRDRLGRLRIGSRVRRRGIHRRRRAVAGVVGSVPSVVFCTLHVGCCPLSCCPLASTVADAQSQASAKRAAMRDSTRDALSIVRRARCTALARWHAAAMPVRPQRVLRWKSRRPRRSRRPRADLCA
jgi:hypothetical protein